jgi:hypothetical protein
VPAQLRARRILQTHAHRFEWEQQIGKQDRRVEAKVFDGSHRYLGRQLGILAQLDEFVPGTQCLVVPVITPGLTHEPNGRSPGVATRQRSE